MISLTDPSVKKRVNKLSDIVRAEYMDDDNFLELYAGQDTIQSVDSIKNQIIYGRRGCGKTHLLKALQEKLIVNFEKERRMPIYLDLRRLLPLIPVASNKTIEYSIILFKQFVTEILNVIIENINFIFKLNEFEIIPESIIHKKLKVIMDSLNIEFDGKEYKKLDDIQLSEEEIKKIALSLELSNSPVVGGSRGKEVATSSTFKRSRYISFSDISEFINELPELLGVKRFICLVDEWSEIPLDAQFISRN